MKYRTVTISIGKLTEYWLNLEDYLNKEWGDPAWKLISVLKEDETYMLIFSQESTT